MKVAISLLFAEAAFAATIGVDKRQFGGLFSALASGDTGILGALGSKLPPL
jgi:hypothetical protein